MRQYRIRLWVTLLALWLPTQALAGLLTECHLFTAGTAVDDRALTEIATSTHDHNGTEHSQTAQVSPDDHCDGHQVATTSSQSDHGQHTEHSGKLPCYHCTSVCHNLQVFVLTEVSAQHYQQDNFKPASGVDLPQNRELDTPQRPPRQVLLS